MSRGRKGLGVLAALGTYGAAVFAALLSGRGLGGLTATLESASSAIATFTANVASVLPLGYAFAAGMVTAFNPCGFALLPSYLALYLDSGQPTGRARQIGPRLWKALSVSTTMTASFLVLFGLTGLLVSIAGSAITRYLPWVGLVIGSLMVLFGGWMVTGRTLYANLGEQLADRLSESARRPALRGYLAYGVAYGAASLSCTLPIFLAVVGSVFAVNGALSAVSEFLLYSLGLGSVITLLTLTIALFRQAAVARVRIVVRYVQPASAVLVLVAGGYLVYYWLTLGGVLQFRLR